MVPKRKDCWLAWLIGWMDDTTTQESRMIVSVDMHHMNRVLWVNKQVRSGRTRNPGLYCAVLDLFASLA